jgi:hypothetical protein
MDNTQIQNSRSWPVHGTCPVRDLPAWGSAEFLQEYGGQHLNQATTTSSQI